MTCGACTPEMFRGGKGRVAGYAARACPTKIAMDTTKLHYMGAQHVFADFPSGNVRYRPGLRRLLKILRPGDKLILASLDALGKRRERAERGQLRIGAKSCAKEIWGLCTI